MTRTAILTGVWLFLVNAALGALPVSEFSQSLDGGIRVRVERGWIMTNADVSYGVLPSGLPSEPGKGFARILVAIPGGILSNNGLIRVHVPARLKMGEVILTNGSYSPPLPPGAYPVSFRYSHPDGRGTVSFKVPGVAVRADQTAELSVTLQTVMVRMESREKELGKLSEFAFSTGSGQRDAAAGIASYPTFFPAKTRDQIVTPQEPAGDESGKIKAGLYDIFIDTDIPRAKYRFALWLENVRMDGDRSYTFQVNLNGARLDAGGMGPGVKSAHFFPAGSAGKIGNRLNRKLQVYFIEGPAVPTPCPPGNFDLLFVFDDGRMEWRENTVLNAGEVTKVK